MTQAAFDWANPDYTPIIQSRVRRLQLVSSDARLREAAKIYYATAGAQGCVEFIERWVWTYDPRTKPGWRPFVLFPKQREFIYWLWDRYTMQSDGLVEKCRDSGATYLAMAFSLYLWLFHSGSKIGFGSRKEILVDRSNDLDSIFEKGRQMLSRIPKFLLPDGFNAARDCPYMRIINPENGNAITGEAGDNIGRGGRSTMYFKDESAFYDHADSIDAALSENSNVKIDISTPHGSNNNFARKRMSGNVPVFTFGWRDDPRKNKAWYDNKVATLAPHIVAQEIDINYYASVDGLVIPPEWVTSAIGLQLDANGPRVAGFDVCDGGADAHALVGRQGPVVFAAKMWRDGTTTDATARAYQLCFAASIDTIVYDSVGVGAGARGEFTRLASLPDAPKYDAQILGFHGGKEPTSGHYAPGKRNKDMFLNIKAQLYWELRDRFHRTHQYVTQGVQHAHETLISLPVGARQLHMELAQPTWSADRADARIVVDKKPDGAASPNLADALVMSFYRRKKIAFA